MTDEQDVEVIEVLPDDGRIEEQVAVASAVEDDVEHGDEEVTTTQHQASSSSASGGKVSSTKCIRNLSRSDKLFIAFMATLVILGIAIPVVYFASQPSAEQRRQEAIATCTATYPPIAYTYAVTDEPTRAPTTSPYPSESPSLSDAPSDNPTLSTSPTLSASPTISPNPTKVPTAMPQWPTYSPTATATDVQRRNLLGRNNFERMMNNNTNTNNADNVATITDGMMNITTISDDDVNVTATSNITTVSEEELKKEKEIQRQKDYEAAGTPRAPPKFNLIYTNTPDPDPNIDTSTRFNYNITPGSKYGPETWGNINVTNMKDSPYKRMIDHWKEWDFNENQCATAQQQSPIDLCDSPTEYCKEYHEIRHMPGHWQLSDDHVQKEILPNKLRLDYGRNWFTVPGRSRPPGLDLPSVGFGAAGNQVFDLYNIDIKIPSEHTVCGKRYDAELLYMTHHTAPESVGYDITMIISFLIEAKSNDTITTVQTGNGTVDIPAYNQHMQWMIDEFQKFHDHIEEDCRERCVTATVDPTAKIEKKPYKSDGKGPKWDPFHEDIRKTVHFWGYRGTITEPPCSRALWRVMDVPVIISEGQLKQLQNILFNRRDWNTCEKDSAQYNGSVARPMLNATLHKIPYYKCTRNDFVSDMEADKCGRGRADGKKGCEVPHGTKLNPWHPPIVDVTPAPSASATLPTYSPTSEAPTTDSLASSTSNNTTTAAPSVSPSTDSLLLPLSDDEAV